MSAERTQAVDPTVSIIIATRNRRELLEEAVASVLAQSYPHWELLVVDDASDDDTTPWLESVEDERVRPLRLDEHGERSRARNLGLSRASGSLVLFFDDDDLLDPQALERHVAGLVAHPDAIASVGSFTIFKDREALARGPIERRRAAPSGRPRVPTMVQIVPRTLKRDVFQELVFGWSAVGGQTVFRREALERAGGWSESYSFAEDTELWLRLVEHGPVMLLADNVLNYRDHGQSKSDVFQILWDIRVRAVESWIGKRREAGRRMLRARELSLVAFEHYERGAALRAALCYLAAFRFAPRIFTSPLMRSTMAVPAVRSVLGIGTLRLLRRLRRGRSA